MNPVLLQIESPHVQGEVAKIIDTNHALEGGVQLAAMVIGSAVRGELDLAALPGDPPAADASDTDWIDYLVVRGRLTDRTK